MTKRAQTTLEYLVMIAVIVAAIFAMQIYVKRGIQGKMREGADSVSQGNLYSPGATVSDSTIATESTETTNSYSTNDPDNSDLQINISETTLQNTRTVESEESTLSYAAEPQRE